ncbi:MAG: tetraacyldisaccharide 4'-kinase [Proteobacteria bacterium]|nr:tetraacyldisaccharide 4'-kinase [Pseudomonadota bacterium]
MQLKNFLFALGRPFSPFYSSLMAIRALLYKQGILKSQKLVVPVISIGNLTMGGTGKTPMVVYISKLVHAMGLKPLVVSRGYGGLASDLVNIVSDGVKIRLSASQAGDEPRLLAESLPGVPVLTGKQRAVVGQYAVTHFKPEVIILDDGFQHLALQRDIDLVLMRADSPFGNGHVFPGGDLREPMSALSRAHAFIVTGNEEKLDVPPELDEKTRNRRLPARPLFLTSYRIVEIVDSKGNQPVLLEAVLKMPLYGFCGIANPQSFWISLQNEGFQIVGFKAFMDHHSYRLEDFKQLAAQAMKNQAKALITTEKDLVKLRGMSVDFPVLVLRVELTLDHTFQSFLKDKLQPLICADNSVFVTKK